MVFPIKCFLLLDHHLLKSATLLKYHVTWPHMAKCKSLFIFKNIYIDKNIVYNFMYNRGAYLYPQSIKALEMRYVSQCIF